MSTFSFPLETVQVANPCPVAWENMAGDDRVRFCSHCQQSVYFLSGLTREEAEALLGAKQGQLCVRYFQKEDGTVMTRDCSRSRRGRFHPTPAMIVLSLLSLFIGLLVSMRLIAGPPPEEQAEFRWRDHEPFRQLFEWLDPSPPPPLIMGKLCPPPMPGPGPQ
jgi:hypothetical protein